MEPVRAAALIDHRPYVVLVLIVADGVPRSARMPQIIDYRG